MLQWIIQIRHLTLVNGEWFTLPVNAWLKSKTAISNKFSINIIPKKQQIGNNNNNNDGDNSDSNDDNKITKFFTGKMTSAENWRCQKFQWIPLKIAQILQNCTCDCELQVNSLLRPSYEQKCFLFFTQNVIHRRRNYSWKRHYKYPLSSSDSWCPFSTYFRVFKKCMF